MTGYLKVLTKGLNKTAKSFEDPSHAEKLRQQKEEDERLRLEMEKQKAAKLLVEQSSEETPSEESSSWFGRVKKCVVKIFSSSPTTTSDVEMTTFVGSEMPKSGFCFDEEQISDMQLAGHGHDIIAVQ